MEGGCIEPEAARIGAKEEGTARGKELKALEIKEI